jgi:hypothetical protein
MPTPAFPSGFKPVVQGYSIGAPDGIQMNEVGGGLPRIAMEWDRGRQPFEVTMMMSEPKFRVWTAFFHRVLKGGAIQFTMLINSGLGLSPHLCMMLPGSYSAVPVGSVLQWSVRFSILAESEAYQMTDAQLNELFALWEAQGEDLTPVLARLAQFANVDTLVLPS